MRKISNGTKYVLFFFGIPVVYVITASTVIFFTSGYGSDMGKLPIMYGASLVLVLPFMYLICIIYIPLFLVMKNFKALNGVWIFILVTILPFILFILYNHGHYLKPLQLNLLYGSLLYEIDIHIAMFLAGSVVSVLMSKYLLE